MRIVLLLGIGLMIGGVSGALGIGGGVLLLPALIWLCGLEPRVAAGTTLAVLVVPVVLPAAWKYHASRLVDVEAAVWIAAAFAVGSYLGAYAVVHQWVPDHVLRLGLGLMMIYIAARFLISTDSEAANAAVGLTATAMGWLGLVGLRLLGRKHLGRPDLSKHIRAAQQQEHADLEYHI